MLYAKFGDGGGVLPSFWLELPVTSVALAEAFSQGLVTGWELGSGVKPVQLDLRLSKHPSERTYSIDELKQLLQS